MTKKKNQKSDIAQAAKIILWVAIVIFSINIIAGLPYYLELGKKVLAPLAKDSPEVLQSKLEKIVDFSFVGSSYDLDLILSSADYKKIKQEVHKVCYDGSLGLYFSCLRAFDDFAALRLNDQLAKLDPEEGQRLLNDLYQIDERYGVPSVDMRNPEIIFKTKQGSALADFFENTVSLDDLNFNNNIDEVYQRASFQKWLGKFRAKKKEICYFPENKDIAEDCNTFTTPYASSVVVDFLYPDNSESEIITLVGVLESGIYKSENEVVAIYNDLLTRYYDDFLNNYVKEMKRKYPYLVSRRSADLSSINDFLLDPNDSLIYQIGKLYFYINYLHVSPKGDARYVLIDSLNNKFDQIAAEFGIDSNDLKDYLIAAVGDEDVIIDQLVKQYQALKNKYPFNVSKFETNPTFLFWESLLEDKYYQNLISDFTDKENYYNDLRKYRLYTYLLLYYSDDYKRTYNRREAFNDRGVNGVEMDNIFEFSRYIERNELDDLFSKYDKPRDEINLLKDY